MTTSSTISAACEPLVAKASHCTNVKDTCKGHHKSALVQVIEKVSFVALAAFAVYTDFTLFLPFFFIGTTIGVYNYLAGIKPAAHAHHSAGGCESDYEDLTGVRLPAPILLLASLAYKAKHMEHLSEVCVPIAGLYYGAWLGELLLNAGSLAWRNIAVVHHRDHVHVMYA